MVGLFGYSGPKLERIHGSDVPKNSCILKKDCQAFLLSLFRTGGGLGEETDLDCEWVQEQVEDLEYLIQ